MNWLSKIFRRSKTDDFQTFVKSISIDTSGPEFADLYPTYEAIREAIVNVGCFKSSDIDWITDIATTQIQSGMNFRGPVQQIVRSGPLMTPDALKAAGLNVRRKVGTRFIEAIAVGTAEEAIEALDLALHTETSKANQLHKLNRMKRIGIDFCKFLGPGEGANLPLEAELTGQRLSIEDAIDLVKSRASEIRRSVFTPEVNFKG
ncbi:hypothetical protein [Rhizobium sp. SL86]|uniref:hypothetical protein n=1 Tax=Rhizobium sp. SL86 TaxID=2995148 RepID=UPI002272BF00|nr:hypothetical protein [Rhizobium sp. SL86]MCY1667336.1 hypothetical protein [Rhizobium sp. SL86]